MSVTKIDDRYVVVLDAMSNRVYFKLIEILGVDTNGITLYQRNDAPSSPDPVGDIEQAEALATGSVMSNGCTSYSIDVHVDDRKGHEDLLRALSKVRDVCLEAMPNTLEERR